MTGVANGEGDGDGDGVAEATATRGAAMVVGTGFTLPASKADAVALGPATRACPSCFDRAFLNSVKAAKLSAPSIIKARQTPTRTTLSENFGELR
jgi:hypothetical protein